MPKELWCMMQYKHRKLWWSWWNTSKALNCYVSIIVDFIKFMSIFSVKQTMRCSIFILHGQIAKSFSSSAISYFWRLLDFRLNQLHIMFNWAVFSLLTKLYLQQKKKEERAAQIIIIIIIMYLNSILNKKLVKYLFQNKCWINIE